METNGGVPPQLGARRTQSETVVKGWGLGRVGATGLSIGVAALIAGVAVGLPGGSAKKSVPYRGQDLQVSFVQKSLRGTQIPMREVDVTVENENPNHRVKVDVTGYGQNATVMSPYEIQFGKDGLPRTKIAFADEGLTDIVSATLSKNVTSSPAHVAPNDPQAHLHWTQQRIVLQILVPTGVKGSIVVSEHNSSAPQATDSFTLG